MAYADDIYHYKTIVNIPFIHFCGVDIIKYCSEVAKSYSSPSQLLHHLCQVLAILCVFCLIKSNHIYCKCCTLFHLWIVSCLIIHWYAYAFADDWKQWSWWRIWWSDFLSTCMLHWIVIAKKENFFFLSCMAHAILLYFSFGRIWLI